MSQYDAGRHSLPDTPDASKASASAPNCANFGILWSSRPRPTRQHGLQRMQLQQKQHDAMAWCCVHGTVLAAVPRPGRWTALARWEQKTTSAELLEM